MAVAAAPHLLDWLVAVQVNPVREKKLTNVRNTGSEEKVSLSPPRIFTLEDAIGTSSAGKSTPVLVLSKTVTCWLAAHATFA